MAGASYNQHIGVYLDGMHHDTVSWTYGWRLSNAPPQVMQLEESMLLRLEKVEPQLTRRRADRKTTGQFGCHRLTSPETSLMGKGEDEGRPSEASHGHVQP